MFSHWFEIWTGLWRGRNQNTHTPAVPPPPPVMFQARQNHNMTLNQIRTAKEEENIHHAPPSDATIWTFKKWIQQPDSLISFSFSPVSFCPSGHQIDDKLHSVLDWCSCLCSHLPSRRGRNNLSSLCTQQLGSDHVPVCPHSIYLKLLPFISLRLLAISAAILLPLFSFSHSHCWLAPPWAFFGRLSSVSSIRPGWPNFILYRMPLVWIHTQMHTHTYTHTLKLGTRDIGPHVPRLSETLSASWWPSCSQRPSHAAALARNSL